ncbi:uncharacterized protein LOC62_03G004303 [Vanrija pseudolonga]|uniref:Extracellular membrane protein CFEM domain-containing protein n=1 Tax=Vanrija pseudolonga TaxID=143232 RepID=A0AAF1BLF1_9TREE|nr:hypothetical protein LOC62_03G004303 [Vanrija pseudolonga]
MVARLSVLLLLAAFAPATLANSTTSTPFCTDSDASISQGCCQTVGGTYDNTTKYCYNAQTTFGPCIVSHFGNSRTTAVAHTAHCEADGKVTWSFASSAGALSVSIPAVALAAIAVATFA